MRLIDADALRIVFTEKSSEAVCGVELCKAIISRIDEAPTVDAALVRHGKWIDRNGAIVAPFWERYECSECGVMSGNNKYCPNCGARMDEE